MPLTKKRKGAERKGNGKEKKSAESEFEYEFDESEAEMVVPLHKGEDDPSDPNDKTVWQDKHVSERCLEIMG